MTPLLVFSGAARAHCDRIGLMAPVASGRKSGIRLASSRRRKSLAWGAPGAFVWRDRRRDRLGSAFGSPGCRQLLFGSVERR
jgi:hypothetical protein